MGGNENDDNDNDESDNDNDNNDDNDNDNNEHDEDDVVKVASGVSSTAAAAVDTKAGDGIFSPPPPVLGAQEARRAENAALWSGRRRLGRRRGAHAGDAQAHAAVVDGDAGVGRGRG
jgi:hypothetical protein